MRQYRMMIHRVALLTRPLLLILAALQSAAANAWDWQKHLHELAARDLPVAHTSEEFQRCPDALGVESYEEPSASGWEESGSQMASLGAYFYTWTRYEASSGASCIRLNAPARELLSSADADALLRAVRVSNYLRQNPEVKPPPPVPTGPLRLRTAKMRFFGQNKPRLHITTNRPLTRPSRTQLERLLSSEPAMIWLCDVLSEYTLACTPHGPPPFATHFRVTVDHRQLRGADGEVAEPSELTFTTPLPSLMAELLATDDIEHPQVELLAPMDLTLKSIRHSVGLTVDGVAVDFTVNPSTPSHFRSRTWSYQVDPDGHASSTRNWNSEPRFAWRLDLPQMRAGQELALRLRAGLRTAAGPLSNQPVDPEGDLLLTWAVPAQSTVRSACAAVAKPSFPLDKLVSRYLASIPPATACRAEQGLALYFDTRPTAAAIDALRDALPAPLRLDPAGLRAIRTDPQFRKQQIPVPASTGYRIEIFGAQAGQRYTAAVAENWRDIHGASLTPESLTWSTSPWVAEAFAPERMTFRRASRDSTGQPSVADSRPKLRLRRADGNHQPQAYAWPIGPPVTPGRLALPSAEAFWATGQQISDSLGWEEPPPIAIAVTDLGLHGLILGEQLLAVVTDLDSGAPIAESAVELRSDSELIAQGRTGSGGTVQLALPPAYDKHNLVLVAHHADRQAVLGIQVEQALKLRRLLPRTAFREDLLLTDKPSYEPGEQVRFWLRSIDVADRRWRTSQELLPFPDDTEPRFAIHAYDDGAGPVSRILTEISDEAPLGIHGSLATPEVFDVDDYTLVASGSVAMLPRTAVLPWSAQLLVDRAALVAGEVVPVTVQARDARGLPVSGRLTTAVATRIDHRHWESWNYEGKDRLQAHFPDFRFVDPWLNADRSIDPCATSSATDRAEIDLSPTNEVGESRGQLRMPLSNCEFAELDLSVTLGWASLRVTRGLSSRRLLTRHPRYLGLSGLAGPRAAVGTQFSFRTIAVEVAQLAERQGIPIRLSLTLEESNESVFTCQLRSGQASPCRWRAERPGTYGLALEAKGYPTARFSLRVGPGAQDPPGREPARLWVADPESFRPSELLLAQPYEAGRVLLVLNDQQWRGSQWFDLRGGTQSLPVDLPADFAGCLHALALVFPASPAGTAVEPIDHARTQLCLDPPSAKLVALTAKPLEGRGDRVRLQLRSLQQAPVTVNLTVFEDLRAIHGPSPLATGALTHCLHFALTPHAEAPLLHSLQGGEVWRNRAQQRGRAEPAASWIVSTGASERCEPRTPPLNPPTQPLDQPLPSTQRNLLWRPELQLAPGEVRVFDIDVPADRADWLVEMLAVDEALQVQTESRSLPGRN